MDFIALVVFLCVYFIRPHDWIGAIEGVEVVRPIMAAVIAGTFLRLGPRLGIFFRTPLDWVMLAYWAWIMYVSPSGTFGLLTGLSLFGFYFFPAVVLDTLERQFRFLWIWTICLVVVALMGVGVVHGFDITNAQGLMGGANAGRLVVNNWLFRNPNALGHTMVLAIPLAYFLWIYRRSSVAWVKILPLLFVAGYCVYLTESKGAFIVGLIAVTLIFVLGRSRMTQICVIALAATIGWGLASKLPRMQEMSALQENEGVIGRMLAWQSARSAMEEKTYGYGFRQFVAEYRWEGEDQTIATHGSYVRIGADLGKTGLFLYVLSLTICVRQLFIQRCTSDLEDRVGKMLLILLVTYAISNWMIDRSYHLEYFMMCGLTSAFLRYMHDKWKAAAEIETGGDEEGEPYSSEQFEPVPVSGLTSDQWNVTHFSGEAPDPAFALPVATSIDSEERPAAARSLLVAMEELKSQDKPFWPPAGREFWMDLLLAIVAFRLVLWFWNYFIETLLLV